jgi:SNF2 family DNA or RNA helicase
MPKVYCELHDNRLYFSMDGYHREAFNKLKAHPMTKFVPEGKPHGPAFSLPKEFELAKQFRELLGDDLVLRGEAKKWAREYRETHDKVASLQGQRSAELERLPEVLPKLHQFMSARPLQLVGAKYIATAAHTLLCDEPGAGKTAQIIGGVFESGRDQGANLVIAPISTLETVWGDHLRRFDQPHPVLVAPPDRDGRIYTVQKAMAYFDDDEPFWLVINPAMLTRRSDFDRSMCEEHESEKDPTTKKPWRKHILRACGVCQEVPYLDYPELSFIDWNTKVFDEFHLAGLGNPDSQTHHGYKMVPAKSSVATSGTPIGGKPIKLYGVLHTMYPKDFKSKWRFAAQWLVVTEEYTSKGKYKKIQGLRHDREQEFYKMMDAFMLRRTMEDFAPDMPPVNVIDLTVEMSGEQARQYAEFEEMAEVRIDDFELSAVGILAEYARLKQFANAGQSVKILPNPDETKPPIIEMTPRADLCPKLPLLKDLLAERGIVPEGEESVDSDRQIIVASESEKMVSMVCTWLNEQKIPAEKITGPVPQRQRDRLVKGFQSGEFRVMCLTTTAGGVGITLDRADTVILLDETWNPDDQTQAIARARRLSRIQRVTAIYIRTANTIQQYIQERVEDKSTINDKVIDYRKLGLFTSRK